LKLNKKESKKILKLLKLYEIEKEIKSWKYKEKLKKKRIYKSEKEIIN
jgi:hypothetical protein